MKIKETTSQNVFWALARAAMFKRERIIVNDVTIPGVMYGSKGIDFDLQYCKANRIKVGKFSHNGGTVVFTPGDLNFTYVSKDKQTDWLHGVRSFVVKYLAQRGVTATMTGNDILIDGKKFSGCSIYQIKGMWFASVFFAIQDSSELVCRICAGNRVDVTGLANYGISGEELKAELLKHISNLK